MPSLSDIGRGQVALRSPIGHRRWRLRIGRAGGRRLGLGTLMAASVFACSGGADPIQQLLEEVVAAAEDRSAEGVAAHLAPGFHGRGLGREEARATLGRYLAAYRAVEVQIYGVSVAREGSTARVGLIAEFSGEVRRLGGLGDFLPPQAAYRFDLQLQIEDGRWLIAGADWEALDPPAR